MQNYGIVIAGVGGQGTLLASRIIGGAAMKQGFETKISEVHGMAQRGGSVITYVQYGREVASPVIAPGRADLVLAFEQLEALRSLPYLKKSGRMVVNTQSIPPMTVASGKVEYPADIVRKIQSSGVSVEALDALALAKEAGSGVAVNVVLIGRLAAHAGIPKDIWLQVLREAVKPQFMETNMRAFEAGYGGGA